MEIVKVPLLLLALAICSVYADQQTVKLTFVKNVFEHDAFNLGIELKTMESFDDDLKSERSYQFGVRKSGEA